MKRFTLRNKSKWMVILFWLIIWQAVSMIVQKEILFVSPFGVSKAFLELAVQADFWHTVFLSLCRMLLGYFLAILIGVWGAILCCNSSLAYQFLYPFIHVIKATPVASFSLLVLLWVRAGFAPVLISFLMVFPLIFMNVFQGMQAMDKELLEMGQAYGFSRGQRWRLLYLPMLLPYFLAACKTGVGMAWKSSVAAEVICIPAGSIGKKLYESKLYLDSPSLFAWTAVVIILSIAIEKGVLWGIRQIQYKMGVCIDENRDESRQQII